ncbi:MAG: hypothetical protein JWO67_6496 [Streptosporangiaceae bacterium]|nr:hypothetical protein [Streptosporangiaceae bacterium]
MCRVEDAEPATLWDEQQRIAAKAHLCSECGRAIQIGERYRHISSLTDGHWSRDRMCAHCMAAGDWLVATCGGYLLTEIYEELVEHWDEGYRSVPFARLIVGMRRKWHDGRDPIPTGMRDLATSMMQKAVR